MSKDAKTRHQLQSKEHQTIGKIKKLTDLRQKYFNEGFTATKERQRYLALKINEIEQEIRNTARNLKTITIRQAGLDIMDILEGRKKHTPATVRPGTSEPVSRQDMDRLYREWEQGKTRRPAPKKQHTRKSTAPGKNPAYTFLAGAKVHDPASIKHLMAAPAFGKSPNKFLDYRHFPPAPEETDPAILNPYSSTSMNDLDVSIQYIKKVNMALVYNDQPILDRLIITNTSQKEIENIMAGVWVSPDYSDSFETSIPVIPANTTSELEKITPPFSTGRLKSVHETEKAMLRLELSDGTRKFFTESYPIEVMPYNEWYIGPEYKFAETIASFIFPNDSPDEPAVEPIISHAVKRLKAISGSTSFDGYQSGDPKKAMAQAQAVFEAIQQDIGLTYINPPASFEFTGQKILSPGQIMEHKRGTCLDTTVLYAACLERLGLHPVVFLVQGHAFAGFWVVDESGLYLGEQRAAKVPVYDAVRDVVEKMYLVPVETTAMTDKRNSFEGAVGAWVQGDGDKVEFRVPGERFHCMVDVWGCRLGGVRPMPV
jgi:hypothetical protein